MELTNLYGLPQPLVAAMRRFDALRGDLDQRERSITCTRLIDSPRRVALERTHGHALQEDASTRLWALWGNAIHQLLASQADATCLVEQRFTARINEWTLSGQVDRYLLQDRGEYPQERAGTLQDYKLSSVWSSIHNDGQLKPEWVSQLNVNAWLMEANGHPVTQLEIVLILRDHAASAAARDPTYPQVPVLVLSVPRWHPEETQTFIVERLARLETALYQGQLPLCDDTERWARPTAYAVRTPTRKTAVRVFATRAEAEELAQRTLNAFVEVRPGQSVRCERYCAVAGFCDQYQAESRRLAA
ncbi:MAG: PD-(D/E)XK nuclease family protein [Chromatiaceae bacterium]|nr:PD-(D/E)XK nuclease family protein [Chromatiaceae bacterium]